MSWRRVVFAFGVTFVCALVVFTLPRFVFNTLQGAQVPAMVQDTVAAPAAVQAPSRGIGSRLTGIFGLVLILAIGFGLSRNRKAISWRVVGWGLGCRSSSRCSSCE